MLLPLLAKHLIWESNLNLSLFLLNGVHNLSSSNRSWLESTSG